MSMFFKSINLTPAINSTYHPWRVGANENQLALSGFAFWDACCTCYNARRIRRTMVNDDGIVKFPKLIAAPGD